MCLLCACHVTRVWCDANLSSQLNGRQGADINSPITSTAADPLHHRPVATQRPGSRARNADHRSLGVLVVTLCGWACAQWGHGEVVISWGGGGGEGGGEGRRGADFWWQAVLNTVCHLQMNVHAHAYVHVYICVYDLYYYVHIQIHVCRHEQCVNMHHLQE